MKKLLITSTITILTLLCIGRNDSGAETAGNYAKAVPISSPKTETATASDENFVTGLENYILYCPANDGDKASKKLSMSTCGQSFDIFAFFYQSGTLVAINNLANGHKTIAMENGKIAVASTVKYNYPLIGISGNGSLKSAEYVVGAHDFTGDNNPELLIAVRDHTNHGIAVYIVECQKGVQWQTIGAMVSKDKGIEECRVFRQTVSFKSESTGTLYTWTCHDGHFDFLASNHVDDPTKLF
jgi:hypothetical protein